MRQWLRSLRTPATFLKLAYQADPGTAIQGIVLLVAGVLCLGLISLALKAWVNGRGRVVLWPQGARRPLRPGVRLDAGVQLGPREVAQRLLHVGRRIARRRQNLVDRLAHGLRGPRQELGAAA